jgi:hypothetical protein
VTRSSERADNAFKAITGVDPRKKHSEAALAAQRQVVARIVFDLYENRGFEWVGLVQMLIAGACFVAEQNGVSRDKLKQVLSEMVDHSKLADGRNLVVDLK